MFVRAVFRTWLGLAVALGLAACGGTGEGGSAGGDAASGSEDSAAPSYADISVEELRQMMETEDPFVVNVHVPFEGDLPETDASIRFDEIAQHLDQLPQDKDANIVLYCRSGRMSAEAGAVLADLGYTHVSNLAGGFRAWEAAGYEMVRDPGSS